MDPNINFRLSLCNFINENELPFSTKYFIFKDVYNEMQQVYEQLLATQAKTEMRVSEPTKCVKKVECEVDEETNEVLSYKESEDVVEQ